MLPDIDGGIYFVSRTRPWERMQDVHASTRLPSLNNVCKLTCCRLMVAIFEWLRMFPFREPRPQMEQDRAIGYSVSAVQATTSLNS